MEVSMHEESGAVVLVPTDDVDLSTARDLQHALREALDRAGGGGRLIVDLAGVPYMDSSGVATLVEAMQIARKKDTALVLCGLQPKVRSIFEIARLDRVFTIVETRADAA